MNASLLKEIMLNNQVEFCLKAAVLLLVIPLVPTWEFAEAHWTSYMPDRYYEFKLGYLSKKLYKGKNNYFEAED